MNICVVGSGYVGLVTGACLADFGMKVVGVDKDADKVEALKRCEIPIYEPGSANPGSHQHGFRSVAIHHRAGPRYRRGRRHLHRGGHTFASRRLGRPELRARSRQIHWTTPQWLQGGDYQEHRTHRDGTNGPRDHRERTNRGDHEFAVVSNPEFLREGSAIADFRHPDRVVIGSTDSRAIDIMLDIYSPLRVADVPFVVTNVESSELIKYASNGFLATKISFINEIAKLSEIPGCGCGDSGPWDGSRQACRPPLSASGTRVRRLLLSEGRPRSSPDRP